MLSLSPAQRALGFYALSIAFGRGLSLLTLPFVAHLLPASEFARLDVTASLIEICGLFASFALADLLFRFAAPSSDAAERKRLGGAILSIALIVAGLACILTQTLVPALSSGLALRVAEPTLRAGLLAAALSGLIELPLAWFRLQDRPALFFVFVSGRALAQAAAMLGLLTAGFDIETVIRANCAIELAVTAILLILQLRDYGLSWSGELAKAALRYCLPVVAGGLAMFGLGNCDRWFLAGAVKPEAIAHYALAAKLALATPLLLQPFALWWLPRRLSLLQKEGGLERSARIVGYGAVILVASATAVVLAGTGFIHLALPAAYQGAADFLPAMVLVSVLNESATLSNAGSYARDHGGEVLLVNALGGGLAVALYALLAAPLGVVGILLATLCGHGLRLGLFLHLGRRLAPIPYPFTAILALSGAAALLIAIRPEIDFIVPQTGYLIAGLSLLLFLALSIGLLPHRILALWRARA